MFNNLLVEDKNQIRTITINRPAQLNALNKETISELHEALKSGDEDKNVGSNNPNRKWRKVFCGWSRYQRIR